MIKKSRLINLRIEDQLLDEIEKIAIENLMKIPQKQSVICVI